MLGRGAAPVVQRQECACEEKESGHPCADCRSPTVQRCEDTPSRAVTAVPPIVRQVAGGGGQALDPGVREEMEEHFGYDFGHVRVHDDAQAALAAGAVNARAYTVGRDIVFGAGRHAPHTTQGRHLLAHELAHVVQQSGAGPGVQSAPDGIAPSGGVHERQAEAAADALLSGGRPAELAPMAGRVQRQSDEAERPSRIALTVSLSGLVLEPPDTLTYRPGPKGPQLMGLVLERLVGPGYDPDLGREAYAELGKGNFERTGGFLDRRDAKGGEPVGTITLLIRPALALIGFLRKKKLQIQLSTQQQELLTLGAAGIDLWADFVSMVKASGNPLPAWYTRSIFERELAQQGKLLRSYAEQLSKARAGSESDRVAGAETVNQIIDALYQPAMVLEAIRVDVGLAAHKDAAEAYTAMWDLTSAGKGRPPTRLRHTGAAVLFLGYARTQPDLARDAEAYSADRAELLRRYAGFVNRLAGGSRGDEQLRDQPATANASAFPSLLSAIPDVAPPLFDAALGTDHRMRMEVQFPSVYEALGRYAFTWERVRIPDEKIGEPVDATKLRGEKIRTGEAAAVHFGRATAYAKADVRRAIDSITGDLGPVGVGALQLIQANAILRYIGTGIRLALDVLTMPSDQKLVTFPSPGLYLVRAAMSQVRGGGEAIVRAPSVAYLPVLAREPDEMATAGVTAARDSREQTLKRIKELEARLGQAALTADERAEITTELDGLRLAVAPLGERLERRRADNAKRIAAIKAGTENGDLEAATEEQERLEKTIALRARRKIGDAEPLNARFVSDLGRTMALTLEVADRPSVKGRAQVYISDVTTPKSGDETGVGKTREDAIADGVRNLLEGIHGYGRGRVAIGLGGAVRTIRIEASLGSLLSESVENLSTVLSIAAVAAAPFTGGASMALLIPIGLVGAVPSAYRVAKRVDAGTFELDLDNALEIVNIAGGVIGLGRLGATSLRMTRVGKALLIVGFGADAAGGILMGAQFVAQLEQLSRLSPGERASALLMLIGQSMISAGLVVGGALVERAHQARAEALTGKHGGLLDETPGGPRRPEPSGPVDKARVDSELNRLGRMDPDSEARLRSDEHLRRALADQPLAASALKKCASPCFPPEVTPEQVARLDKLLGRLAETGEYDEAALKKYFHDRRTSLSDAINQIEGVKTAGDLNAWVRFLNGDKGITKLPPQGDPKLLMDRRDESHDHGVAGGRAEALKDKRLIGFDNPIKQGRYGQGFDDIMLKGTNVDVGDIYLLEYKGGDARLAKGQMEALWVIGNIQRLYAEGGQAGRDWARILAKALREGRLKGIAYSTPLKDRKPQPTTAFKNWAYEPFSIKFP